jgi:hypothetical protein
VLVALDHKFVVDKNLVLTRSQKCIFDQKHLFLSFFDFTGLAPSKKVVRYDQAMQIMSDSHHYLFRVLALIGKIVEATRPFSIAFVY